MVKHICDYCQKAFTTKSNLNRHQSGARYCLQTRGLETAAYTCDCGKQYTWKTDYRIHQDKCLKNNKDPTPDDNGLMLQFVDMVKELQRQNGDLQKQMAAISLRPTKVINNNTNVLNNLQPITDEDLQENLDNLKLNFILEGAKGYANYANFYPLNNNIICTDKARKKIKYKDENGDVTDDSRLLARRFFQAISTRNKDILDTAYKDIHEEVKEIVAENRAGDSDITGLLTKAAELQNILIRSQRAATGEDDEFTQEFLNHLAKML